MKKKLLASNYQLPAKRHNGSGTFLATESWQLKAGFTLLFAVLISNLILAIGIATFNLTVKQVILSSAGRESQFAFFAADSGVECALFWDFEHNAFAVSQPIGQIICNGATITEADDGGSLGGRPYGTATTFTFNFPPDPYCAKVSVTKYDNPRRTVIDSRGYNTCDIGNPRRVERGIRANY